jgi:phosphoribosylamine--glycine ligase
VKPDAPARGAGVGVWGSDFGTSKGAEDFFMGLLSKGRVVVEERVEGEESSFHAFSDGKHFVPSPLSRDYKRSRENNRGSLTGGMGSYRGSSNHLPFLSESDWDLLVSEEARAFKKWKGRGSNLGLRGVVLYDAIMHTGKGFKVLERNSRGGNTEFINLLATLDDDFADICFRILDGTLKGIRFRRSASVVTCAVPISYGTKTPASDSGEVDLTALDELKEKSQGGLLVYPMDVRLEHGRTLMGRSRTVAVVGVGPSTDEAREESLRGVRAIRGPVRWRKDVASPADIGMSREHLARILGRA